MRAAIYARYSSDLQSARSIDDQVSLCRAHADAVGWQVVAVYSDHATSGALPPAQRPGLAAALAGAAAGACDVIVAEGLDRLSRDQEHIAALFKRLRYADVALYTIAEGAIGELHVGLKGTMNALFLKDLADKTRRGQRGRAAAGFIPGGLSYGYRLVPATDARGAPERGRRAIDPAEAAVVRRIFEEYVTGKGPRAIAADLNREGVSGPRGRAWNASTINGSRARRNGILHNELYAGRVVYNRQRFVKDPETGRRTARANPPSAWTIAEVPALRIVAAELWERAQALKAALAPTRVHQRRRPKRLLSGLIFCGRCGGRYTVIGVNRMGCTAYREGRSCANGRTISVPRLERRVLDGVRQRLLAPDVVAEFVREYHREKKRQRQAARRDADALRERVAALDGRIARIVAAIETGTDTPALRARLPVLERDRAAAARQLDAVAGDADDAVLEMHPNLPELYRARVAELEAALNADADARRAARAQLRRLIDRIVLHPGPERGQVAIELHGQLAALMNLARAQNETGPGARPGPVDRPDVMLMMVAGAGFEPATFRL